MPFLPEGNTPSSADNELRSLWKINGLCNQWAANLGKTPQCAYLGGTLPTSADNEAISLQKINVCIQAIAGF